MRPHLSNVSKLLTLYGVEHEALRDALGIPLRRGLAPDLYVRSCAKGVVTQYFDNDVDDQVLSNQYQVHTFAAEMARAQFGTSSANAQCVCTRPAPGAGRDDRPPAQAR